MPKTDIWTPVNLADMFLTSAELHAGREALKYKSGHHYESLTYDQLREEVFSAAKALAEMGLAKGVRAVIISENRPEWVITDLAIQLLGAVNVPIHSVLSTQQISEIITEVKPDFIFYSDKQVEDKLLSLSSDISKIKHLVSYEKVEDSAHSSRLTYFKDLTSSHLSESDKSTLVDSALKIKPDDLCSIIYTSGTEGHLKGVRLSHTNFIQNVLGTMDIVKIFSEDKFFSILPLSHVFERAAGYYIAVYAGASVGFCVDPGSF
jgi:long-chain acyl-CoA synthetase